jgi:2-haloacid dehalogenase
MRDRWATFDCYGTLVDWNAGIRTELDRLFGERRGEALLARYHAIEPRMQEESPVLSYREVMARVLAQVAGEAGVELADEERDALGHSLPRWPVFPEVPTELAAIRERGWKLAILSNTDRDLIEASMRRIGVPFELAIVASEIGSYKPAPRHWEAFYERTGADCSLHVHVAASLYHDIRPVGALGIPAIWINRLGDQAETGASRELMDLSGLADAADRLVPAPER